MRSEAWRPAAAARNRSSREARDPARQALRPGCEVLAVRIPEAMPETEARVRSQKPPRWSAERRASRVWDARRLARRLACRVWHAQRVLRRAPQRLSALRLPLFWGERSKRCKTPGAEMRRGNEEVLLDASTEANTRSGEAAEQRRTALVLSKAHARLGLWRLCDNDECRRSKRCGGDVDQCGARTAPQGWTWLHHVLNGLREGLRSPRRSTQPISRPSVIASE
jgi:hypothetical protein